MKQTILLATAVLLCGGIALAEEKAAPATETPAAPYKLADGPYPVETAENVTLHDAKRSKDLLVTVTYPKGDGPWPTIIFSHGAGGAGHHYFPLTRYWASHGYVCLAPTHADSLSLRKADSGGGMLGVVGKALGDGQGWVNRAADASFVIDSIPQIEQKVPALKGKMDPKRLGMSGHSYGAFVTQLLAGATVDLPGGEKGKSMADPRPIAFLVLSGQGTAQFGFTERSWGKVSRPMMVMTGTRDRGATGKGWQWKLEPFKFAPPGDKFSVCIQDAFHNSFTGRAAEGKGGGLLSLLTGDDTGSTDQKAVFDYVKIATLAFWDAYVGGDAKAKAYLQSDALPSYSKGAVKLERK